MAPSSKFKDRSFVREVELPSRGIRYGGALPGGRVHVAAISLAEQLTINSAGGGTDEPIERLLTELVDYGTSGLTSADLLTGDRLFLLFQIRALSFGPVKWKEQCARCGHQQELSIALDTLPVLSLRDDEVEPFVVDLPSRGVSVALRSLRKRDEDAIATFVEKTGNGANKSASMLPRLASRLVRVGDESVDMTRAMVWLTQPPLEGPDLLTLEQAIEDNEPGVDTTIEMKCANCGAQNQTEVLLDATFFRPVTRRRSRP